MVPPTDSKISSQSRSDIEYKIVIVGDTKVGKTTIIQSLSGTEAIGRGYSVSLKIELSKKKHFIGRIYDLRSQRYFPYLHSLYYHGAKGAIVVFDITKKDSFNSVKKWCEIIWGHAGNIPILLCGNKSDLRHDNEEQISIEEAKELAADLSSEYKGRIDYVEISAEKNIIAVNEIKDKASSEIEDIYPTTEAFRKPFINWLFAIIKKG